MRQLMGMVLGLALVALGWWMQQQNMSFGSRAVAVVPGVILFTVSSYALWLRLTARKDPPDAC